MRVYVGRGHGAAHLLGEGGTELIVEEKCVIQELYVELIKDEACLAGIRPLAVDKQQPLQKSVYTHTERERERERER
jgi:hypothetical protein